MKFIKNIEVVDILYLGDQNLKKLNYEFKNQYDIKLPLVFYINGHWRIQHKCCNCNELVITGADEPIMGDQPNFKRLPYLREKFFDLNVLKDLYKLFSHVLLIKLDEYKIVNENYNKDFPIPVELFQYSCGKCNVNYLANYTRGYGSDGERGMPLTPDKISITEIIVLDGSPM